MVAAPLLVMADEPGPGRGSLPPATWATEPVSVIVPYYQARNKLDLTLAALLRQDYPQELTEIIVVDDGSDPPLTPADVPEGARVVTQRRDGFGAARARNNGARAAAGSILVFVDGDMALSPNNLSAHAAWHHRAPNLCTTLCDIRLVDDGTAVVDDLDSIPHRTMRHLVALPGRMKRPDALSCHDALKTLPGPNFAIRKDSYWYAGGQCEAFRHWGLEDTHFLHRAYAHGLSVVLITQAYGLHLGSPTYRIFHVSGAMAEQMIPSPAFRKPNRKRAFLVPEYVVSIRSDSAEALLSTAFDVLEHRPYDLALRVDLRGLDERAAEFVKCRLEHDGRVGFGPLSAALDDFPESPFHVRIHADCIFKSGLVRRLRRKLRGSAYFAATGDAGYVEIIRAGMAHHRRRYPFDPSSTMLRRSRPISDLVKGGAWYDAKAPIDEPRVSRLRQMARRFQYVRDTEGLSRAIGWLVAKIERGCRLEK